MPGLEEKRAGVEIPCGVRDFFPEGSVSGILIPFHTCHLFKM